MLLTRPTKLADLVIDGKGVYQPDPKNQRQIWWRAAGEVLRTPENDECDLHSDRGVAGGVTPAVLSTEISRRYHGPRQMQPMCLVCEHVDALEKVDFRAQQTGTLCLV